MSTTSFESPTQRGGSDDLFLFKSSFLLLLSPFFYSVNLIWLGEYEWDWDKGSNFDILGSDDGKKGKEERRRGRHGLVR